MIVRSYQDARNLLLGERVVILASQCSPRLPYSSPQQILVQRDPGGVTCVEWIISLHPVWSGRGMFRVFASRQVERNKVSFHPGMHRSRYSFLQLWFAGYTILFTERRCLHQGALDVQWHACAGDEATRTPLSADFMRIQAPKPIYSHANAGTSSKRTEQ